MDKNELEKQLLDSPFHELLDLRLISFDEESGVVEIEMPFNPAVERGHNSGQFHGGIIASFIDIAGDYAVGWNLGFGVPTINFRTDFLRPAFNTALRARASVRRVGRTVGVADVDVFDDQDRLVAVGRGCYGTRQG